MTPKGSPGGSPNRKYYNHLNGRGKPIKRPAASGRKGCLDCSVVAVLMLAGFVTAVYSTVKGLS